MPAEPAHVPDEFAKTASAVADGLQNLFGDVVEQTLPARFGKPLGWLVFAFSGCVALGGIASRPESSGYEKAHRSGRPQVK